VTYVIALPCVDLRDLGSPGKAFKVGVIAHDHPLVTALSAAGAGKLTHDQN
jgi:hypothetical protein